MSADPLVRLAQQRIISLSAGLEVQLSERKGGAVAIEMLRRLKDNAATSMAALVIADAEKPADIRTLQNEVKRYDEWIGWMKEILNEGVMYDKQFTDADREELLDLLMQSGRNAEAIALGLVVGVDDGGTREE